MNLSKDLSGNFEIFQDRLDREIQQTAQSFVRIGYLLKVARDTNILASSGYKDVNEYAKARYGLSRDLVSRYMAINDRFSEGGYSETLIEKHRGIGMTKLAEMLTLSDEVIAAIPSGTTREEIREIKAEIAEEEKITDIEVALEPPLPVERTILQEVLFLYFQEIPERYPAAHTEANQPNPEGLLEVFAPTGQAVKIVRIPGKGKLMLSFDGPDPVTLVNLRTDESRTYTWKEFASELRVLCPASLIPEKAWENLYGQPFPEKEPKKQKKVEVVKPERKPEKPAKPEKNIPKQTASKQNKPETPVNSSIPEDPGPETEEEIEPKTEEETEEEAESEEEAEEEEIVPAQYYPREISRLCNILSRNVFEKDYEEAEKKWKEIGKMLNVLKSAPESDTLPGQMSLEDL